MNYTKLTNYWITKHNEQYYNYLTSIKEPRYGLKTFFLNSYYLFKALGKEWERYLERYPNLFRRDPANDFYKYRDPIECDGRLNSLEWTTAFEIVGEFGFPGFVCGRKILPSKKIEKSCFWLVGIVAYFLLLEIERAIFGLLFSRA